MLKVLTLEQPIYVHQPSQRNKKAILAKKTRDFGKARGGMATRDYTE